jgi:hypothetical protein
LLLLRAMGRTTAFMVLAATWLGGCAMADPADETATPLICDGSSDIRLAVAAGGGGPVASGTAMLTENGDESLLVDGSCQAWISRFNQPVRTRVLSKEREQMLATALRLSQWNRFGGTHPGGCADGPGISLRFGEQRVSGSACGLPPSDPLSIVTAAFGEQIQVLAGEATDLAGDVRYLLLRESGPPPGDTRAAVAWPLDVPIASVVYPESLGPYVRGGSHLATGADAARLRGIRTAATAAGTGPAFEFTPIAGAGGVVYSLYLRDALPQEGPVGLLPSGTF